MFPPLDQTQVPDIWFCPVCVGRTWHVPQTVIQTPPSTLPSSSVAATPRPPAASHATEEKENLQRDAASLPTFNKDSQSNPDADTEVQNRRWREVQRWKENAWLAPRGHMLDPSSTDMFIPIQGEGPSISMSTVLQNRSELPDKVPNSKGLNFSRADRPAASSSVPEIVHSRARSTGKGGVRKSPQRKRSKYSDLPRDIERALDLIASHLGDSSQLRKSQEDAETKSRAGEQKMRIQEGELLICRQELQAVQQRLSIEISNVEKLRAENAELRQELLDSRKLAERKANEMKNWQSMLRTMMSNGEGPSVS